VDCEWVFTEPMQGDTHYVEATRTSVTWNAARNMWVTTGGTSFDPLGGGVGSIMQSMLSEQQFASAYPGETARWVLADGRSCAGSRYEQITGQHNVPDMRGRFLRTAGAGAGALGSLHDDTTRLPRQGWNPSTAGGHDHAGVYRYTSSGSGGGSLAGHAGTNPPVANSWEGQINPLLSAGAHTHVIGGGDLETAPKHIVVNTFIRIN
jgi:hypothetical protein